MEQKKPRFWARGGVEYEVKTRTVLNGLCDAKPLVERRGGE